MTDLQVDPVRANAPESPTVPVPGQINTGIYVRAKDSDKWVSVDIARLDKASLLMWLRSRGGDNPWAENVVGILLGYGPLHHPKREGP